MSSIMDRLNRVKARETAEEPTPPGFGYSGQMKARSTAFSKTTYGLLAALVLATGLGLVIKKTRIPHDLPAVAGSGSAEQNFQVALFDMRAERYDEAFKKFLEIEVTEPDNDAATVNLALIEKKRGQLASSEDRLRKLLDRAQVHSAATAHNNLAVVSAEKKDFEEARRQLEKALALLPGYPEATLNLAQVLERQKSYPEATRLYQSYAALAAADPRLKTVVLDRIRRLENYLERRPAGDSP